MTMPHVVAEIAFARDPGDNSPLWVNITPYVEWPDGVRISRRRSHELDQPTPGTLSALALNDGRFTVENPASPYYPNVLINRPIRIRTRYPDSPNLLHTGQAAGTDPARFSVTAGTLAADAGVVAPGQTSSIRWTASLSNGSLLRVGTSSASTPTDQAISVTAGQAYAVGCQARRGAAGTAAFAARIYWYDLSGDQLGITVGPAVTLSTSWQAISSAGTAPAGAVWARVLLQSTTASGVSTMVYTGAFQFEQAAAPTSWTMPGLETIRYRGYVDKWPLHWHNGVLAQTVITCTDQMKLLGRAALADPLIDGQLSGARVVDLLAAAGITSSHIDPGLSVLGLSGDEVGQKILPQLRAVAASEAGLFFIRGDGEAAFHDRGRRQGLSVPVLTLTGDQLGPDLQIITDDALLLNDITIRAATGATHQILGATSIDRYGRYSAEFDTLLTADQIANRARALFNAYEEPRPRAGQISIAAHTLPALLPALVALEIGDRIQVTDLPPEAPAAVLDLWVEGIAEVITDQEWIITLDTSPAAASAAFVLDSPDFGVLDTSALGW